MSSASGQYPDKKSSKPFDFKWFPRSLSSSSHSPNGTHKLSVSRPPSLTPLTLNEPNSDRKKHQFLRSSSVGSTFSLGTPRKSRTKLRSRSSTVSPPILENINDTVPFPARLATPEFPNRLSKDATELDLGKLDKIDKPDKPDKTDKSDKTDKFELRIDAPTLREHPAFLSWRRKTDDSRSRSRSSSLARSVRCFVDDVPTHSRELSSSRERSISASTSVCSWGSDSERIPAWERRTLPLQPPPTIGLGSVLEDEDVRRLRLDPMAVRYADHMHLLGYTHNRYICAMLAEDAGVRGDRAYNQMVMQAFVMRMLKFHTEPLDMSLRKFLFRVALPPEAQQIERVLQTFSVLWHYHNPQIFKDEEQVLSVTFSLLMLHTDQFNKNVKRKMAKTDFVRNAVLDDVAPEIFAYFYDNITAAPFRADDDAPSVAAIPGEVLAAPPLLAPSPALSSPHLLGPPLGAAIGGTSFTVPVSPQKKTRNTSFGAISPTTSPADRRSSDLGTANPENISKFGQELTVDRPTELTDEKRTDEKRSDERRSDEKRRPSSVKTPSAGSPFNFGGTPTSTGFPLPPPLAGAEETNSLGSRRSSSFTWLRDHALDPYPYLLENRLDALRPELSGVPDFSEIDGKPLKTAEEFCRLQEQLSVPQTLQIVLPKSRPEVYIRGTNDEVLEAQTKPGTVAVEILRSGNLLRREWKRTFAGQRPGWREWGVLLTHTRLYLFKNSQIAKQMQSPGGSDRGGDTCTSIDHLQTATVLTMSNIAAVVVPRQQMPDENLFVFMLVESGGHGPLQHCFVVRTEHELTSWVRAINLVATQTSLQIDVSPKSPLPDLQRAKTQLCEQISAVQNRIDWLATTLRHFELLAPLHHRTRESLVFTAGGYASKCEDAMTEMSKLRAYENVLSMAILAHSP